MKSARRLSADARGTRLKGRLDGKRLLPYYTRAEINQGKGVANAPILAWVEDPVELFFLQVQGSGRIQLDDGSFVHIGYAEQNGYGYQSIGKWLVDKGELTMSNASMQGIRTGWRATRSASRNCSRSTPAMCSSRPCPETTAVRWAPWACR